MVILLNTGAKLSLSVIICAMLKNLEFASLTRHILFITLMLCWEAGLELVKIL